MRTPLAKAFKGSFKDTELDYIIYVLLKELIAKSKIDPALIEDVCLGNVRHSSPPPPPSLSPQSSTQHNLTQW